MKNGLCFKKDVTCSYMYVDILDEDTIKDIEVFVDHFNTSYYLDEKITFIENDNEEEEDKEIHSFFIISDVRGFSMTVKEKSYLVFSKYIGSDLEIFDLFDEETFKKTFNFIECGGGM